MKKQQKEQSMANKVTEQKINENCYSEITFDEKCIIFSIQADNSLSKIPTSLQKSLSRGWPYGK